MSIHEMMAKSAVGVWDYARQRFVLFVPCPGEKRVRIDVYDDLSNYAVYPGSWSGNVFTPSSQEPLGDWRVDLT